MSPSPDRPLNDAERDRMDAVLSRFRIDGFFAALICSPEIAKPIQYLPEIWGGEDGAGGSIGRRRFAYRRLSIWSFSPQWCHQGPFGLLD